MSGISSNPKAPCRIQVVNESLEVADKTPTSIIERRLHGGGGRAFEGLAAGLKQQILQPGVQSRRDGVSGMDSLLCLVPVFRLQENPR